MPLLSFAQVSHRRRSHIVFRVMACFPSDVSSQSTTSCQGEQDVKNMAFVGDEEEGGAADIFEPAFQPNG